METITDLISKNVCLPNVEIEARVGIINFNKFDSSVTPDVWNKICGVLEKWDGWVKKTSTRREIVINNDIKENYRLVTDSSDNIQYSEKKERIDKKNFKCKHSPWDLRVAVAQEFKLSNVFPINEEHPSTVKRIKNTKSFYHKFWRYDFSIVSQNYNGVSKEVFEIEIELWNTKEAMHICPKYIAEDLMCKFTDIVNVIEKTEKPIQLTLQN